MVPGLRTRSNGGFVCAGNEPSGSMKAGEHIDRLSNYQLLNNKPDIII